MPWGFRQLLPMALCYCAYSIQHNSTTEFKSSEVVVLIYLFVIHCCL